MTGQISRHSRQSQLVIGTYTMRLPWADGRADGILTVDGCHESATTAAQVPNPSYVAATSDKRFVFAVSEIPDGTVTAFERAPGTGRLRRVGSCASGGDGPCHLTVSPDNQYVVVANYITATVAALPFDRAGSLAEASSIATLAGPGSGIIPARQEAPHAHQAVFDPVTGNVLVPDLGADRICILALHEGLLEQHGVVELGDGAGPRQLAFDPSGAACYVVEELSNRVTALVRSSAGFEVASSISTLPPGVTDGMAGSVCVSPDGEHLYVSNRGSDTIASFRLTDKSRPEFVACIDSGGQNPRDIQLSGDGCFLYVANQDSDRITRFTVECDGNLRVDGTIRATSPASVLPLF